MALVSQLVSDLRHAECAIRAGVGPVVLTAALAVGCAVAMPVSANCQNPAPAAKTTPPATHAAASLKHRRPAKPKPAPVVAVVPPLPTPPPPNWPANDKAAPPSVNWNGRDLTIAATNSSLAQILTEVSTATGVKVEGEQSDQRIFGSYGPAPARDVLNQLLDGSGYNVLIIGDKGEGTPRELVLTAKGHAAQGGPGQNAQGRQNSEDDTPEPPEQPEQPEQPNYGNPGNLHRPFGMQPGQGRTPEQLQQEQQMRQQQLQQQQLQQQPQPQQPNPQPPND